jgi:hypothetical protein
MVTLDNEGTAKRFEHINLTNRDKTPLRAKRYGKTKRWKTRPNDFAIPVKYGLRTHFYITNVPYKDYQPNNHEWNITETK